MLLSGILLLQDRYWQDVGVSSTKDIFENMFPETQPALDALTRMCVGMRAETDHELVFEDELTVFLMQMMYQGASTLITIGQGSPDEDIRDRLSAFKWFLQYLQSRWRVASK